MRPAFAILASFLPALVAPAHADVIQTTRGWELTCEIVGGCRETATLSITSSYDVQFESQGITISYFGLSASQEWYVTSTQGGLSAFVKQSNGTIDDNGSYTGAGFIRELVNGGWEVTCELAAGCLDTATVFNEITNYDLDIKGQGFGFGFTGLLTTPREWYVSEYRTYWTADSIESDGVINIDPYYTSAGFIRRTAVTGTVSEPAPLALVLAPLLGIFGISRRKIGESVRLRARR